MFLRATSISLFLMAALPAQGAFTSPLGLDTREGNATFFHFSGNRRLQVIDNTIGAPRPNLRSIAFRRDGLSTVGTGEARQMEVVLAMGVGSWAQLSNNFDANYRTGTKTEVFARRFVSFPDWTAVPPAAPAPFDFVLPFDAAWSYPGGGDPMIWDLISEKSDPNGVVPMDRFFIDQENGLTGTPVGTGCTSTGQTQPFEHTASLINRVSSGSMSLRVGAQNAPAQGPTFLHLDLTAANIAYPGLCANLRVAPTLMVNLGNASSTGMISPVELSLGYNAIFEGVTVHTQLVSIDQARPGLPFSISNGMTTEMPTDIQVAYHWAQMPIPFGTIFVGGAPVAQFQ